ncbi:hypothetical protein F5B22DRAFT_628701 [Xylaria bambusicola]|uniref:uncharacterized protein n=1 Tax=Xylaria bambusicola TaxID=326684 RepID=UPI002007F948|nr:uncharacterized protein F5B22DRAFT_628701 [Xylaria bambusicola]KAI0505146.1 hypothetical protein F5B22DRAFT_628701 [Xylaria bambusicola]
MVSPRQPVSPLPSRTIYTIYYSSLLSVISTQPGYKSVVQKMCTYYYLHYHHVAPCSKGIEYAIQYSFCPNATTTETYHQLHLGNTSSSFSSSSSSSTSRRGHREEAIEREESQLIQQPCSSLTHADYPAQHQQFSSTIVDYYSNPCATGGCLLSQHCASGGCRLDELGGRWACCRCGFRGGNTFRWCVHRVRKVPDALCYHVVCRGCRAD